MQNKQHRLLDTPMFATSAIMHTVNKSAVTKHCFPALHDCPDASCRNIRMAFACTRTAGSHFIAEV